MLTLVRTAAIVFTTHAPRLLRSRRFLVMTLMSLIPPAVLLVFSGLRKTAIQHDPVVQVVWFLTLNGLLPLITLLAGAAVISEEIADRTITYVLTRPISRSGFLLGRWLVASLSAVLAASLSLGLCCALGTLPRGGVPPSTASFPLMLTATCLGAVTYTAVFCLLSACLRHPMLWGLGYALALEGLFANLPGNTASLSIQHHIRTILVGYDPSSWHPVATIVPVEYGPPELAVWTLIEVMALSLVGACLIFQRRQFVAAS